MGRTKKIQSKERLNVWVLPNQVRDLKKVQEVRGITQTAAIIEALALWLSLMGREGVL